MSCILCASTYTTNFVFAFLLAFACILFVAVLVLSLMIYLRARADRKRVERYVYVRETSDKVPICANDKKKEDKDIHKASNDKTVAKI